MNPRTSVQFPTLPVHYRICDQELTAIMPTLPGTYALESIESFTWADGWVELDLAYAASGSPAAPSAYQSMHDYLIRRFQEERVLQIIETIEQAHHDARHAQLRSSIAALKRGEGSPPWTPAALAELRAADAALS